MGVGWGIGGISQGIHMRVHVCIYTYVVVIVRVRFVQSKRRTCEKQRVPNN